jgi:CheY-like chemotaxis protein
MTHERNDGGGFPNRPLAQRIPIESQLIQFCQELDSRTLVKMGELRRNPRVVRDEWIRESVLDTDRFGPQFCKKLNTAWGSVSLESLSLIQGAQKAIIQKAIIIDAKVEVCDRLSESLLSFGVVADSISDPSNAFKAIHEMRPTTIILEISCSRLSELNLLKMIDEIPDYHPTVLLMSDHPKISQEDDLNLGGYEWFQKPGDFDRLVEKAIQTR